MEALGFFHAQKYFQELCEVRIVICPMIAYIEHMRVRDSRAQQTKG